MATKKKKKKKWTEIEARKVTAHSVVGSATQHTSSEGDQPLLTFVSEREIVGVRAPVKRTEAISMKKRKRKKKPNWRGSTACCIVGGAVQWQ